MNDELSTTARFAKATISKDGKYRMNYHVNDLFTST